MNKRVFLIAGLAVLLAVANSCGTPSCAGSGAVNHNAGISSTGQGISAGKNVNFNGAVNVNGNNGPGIVASGNSVISNINKGPTYINTGKNSAITTSGARGSSTSNSGTIKAGSAAGAGRGAAAGTGLAGFNLRGLAFQGRNIFGKGFGGATIQPIIPKILPIKQVVQLPPVAPPVSI